jgi:hypothetical protein
MAVNQTRSMNYELDEGRTDGVVRKVARNRAGEVDAGTRNSRKSLHPEYGFGYFSSDDDGSRYLFGDEAIPR